MSFLGEALLPISPLPHPHFFPFFPLPTLLPSLLPSHFPSSLFHSVLLPPSPHPPSPSPLSLLQPSSPSLPLPLILVLLPCPIFLQSFECISSKKDLRFSKCIKMLIIIIYFKISLFLRIPYFFYSKQHVFYNEANIVDFYSMIHFI